MVGWCSMGTFNDGWKFGTLWKRGCHGSSTIFYPECFVVANRHRPLGFKQIKRLVLQIIQWSEFAYFTNTTKLDRMISIWYMFVSQDTDTLGTLIKVVG